MRTISLTCLSGYQALRCSSFHRRSGSNAVISAAFSGRAGRAPNQNDRRSNLVREIFASSPNSWGLACPPILSATGWEWLSRTIFNGQNSRSKAKSEAPNPLRSGSRLESLPPRHAANLRGRPPCHGYRAPERALFATGVPYYPSHSPYPRRNAG
jgi:hypothetical protein